VTEPIPADIRAQKEDEWLVVRCQLGERAAFDELIDRWHGPLSTYLRRLAADDEVAREVAQDAWLRVLRGIARLRDGSKLRPWLFGIARRALMDRLRERYAVPTPTEVEMADIPAGPATGDLEDELRTMEHQLGELPVVEREVLTLFYLRELSLNDVAEVLGIPVGTVKSRLFRGRRMLRREIESHGGRT
jgi:RNA polymerase sigma-70 factor (ECF subfamily)